MRRLPVFLLAAVTAVPGLIVALDVPAGAAPISAGTPESPARGPAAPTGAGSLNGAGPVAKPVATRVRRVSLSGVDAGALTSLAAQGAVPGTRGAPGAVAQRATSAPSVLTKRLDTAGFETLGVTWRAVATEPDLLISIRNRGATGWSGWEQLDDDTGEDPTRTSAVKPSAVKPSAATSAGPATSTAAAVVRGGTGPLWVGPSTGVQVRIVVRSGRLPADLKIELVDPGTSGYDAVATAAGPLSAASASKPAVYSRAQWGAVERRVRDAPTHMRTIKGAVLHHTAGRNHYSASQVPSILRGDYAYHLSRGWDDIGYNALVDRFGRIWEGRGGGLENAVMGAHAGGFNTDTFGVSMIGNYDVSRPTAASIAAVTRLMAWKLDLHHRDPMASTRLTSSGGGTARYRAGRTVTLPVIMGHRNTGYTACPGRYLYPHLGSIRVRARALIKAALLDPAGPPASVPRGTTVSIRARALAAQSWRLAVTAPFGGGQVARRSGSTAAGGQIRAGWNGRTSAGALVRPGRYRLTLTSRSARGTARPVVADVLVVPPAPAAEVPATPSAGPGGYFPVTPTRLLDTRAGRRVGLGPNGRVDIPVLGVAGVPATGVTSVVLNLTASRSSADTSLAVWPSGRKSSRPLTGVPAGVTRSVLVTTRVGGGGAVSVGNATGVTELTADVVGYFGAGGSSVRSIASSRIYSSLKDPAGMLVGGQPRSIRLPATLGGIAAAQITGVVLDVSVLSPSGAGTLTAYRPGTAGKLTSLTYRAGESIDNLAFVEVSDGAITLRSSGRPVHAVLDVRAVLTAPAGDAGTFTALKPTLVLDTRTTGGAVKAGFPRKLVVTGRRTGVPAGASAVVIDLTGIAPAAKTWLQVYAWGRTSSGGTALRVTKGDTRGNLIVVPIGPGGAITIANARGGVEVRADVYGYLD